MAASAAVALFAACHPLGNCCSRACSVIAAPTAATSGGAPTSTEPACCAMLGLTIQTSIAFLNPAGGVAFGLAGSVGAGTGTFVGNVVGLGVGGVVVVVAGVVLGVVAGGAPGAGGNVTAGERVSPLLSKSFESTQPNKRSLLSIATTTRGLLLPLQALDQAQQVSGIEVAGARGAVAAAAESTLQREPGKLLA